MQLGTEPLDRLAIPDGTTVEEHDLVTDGNVVVGGQSTVEFGVRGHSVIAGERVRFDGHVEAEGDCRLDMWCTVADNVLVGENAYLGERVEIDGELKVAGDLDIGDDVDIAEGFEANGWIVIRNPMPTIVFLFVYLSHLLRIGEEEAAEDVVDSMTESTVDADPALIPRGAHVSDDVWRVSTPATIGDDCRLHGNIRAESVEVGRDGVVFGSLRARDDVVVGRGTEIKGDVTTRDGDVRIGPGVKVWGDVAAEHVALHENATVDGAIRADGELELHTDAVIDRPDETAEAMAEMAEGMENADRDDGSAGEQEGGDDEEYASDDEPASDESASASDESASTNGTGSTSERNDDGAATVGADTTEDAAEIGDESSDEAGEAVDREADSTADETIHPPE